MMDIIAAFASVAASTVSPEATEHNAIEMPMAFRGEFVLNGSDCASAPLGLRVLVGKDFLDYSESISVVVAIRKINDQTIELDLKNEAGSDEWISTDRIGIEKNGESLSIQRLTENNAPYQDDTLTYYGRCK